MTEKKFRTAEKKDVPLILDFIKRLAEYEKMSGDVEATTKLLEETLFEKQGAKVLFALDENGKEVGFALYFYNYSTFLARRGIYLEDLFVLPEHRGKGYGKALIKNLAETALSEGCGRLEWSCLDWNTPSIDFYKSIGASPLDEWTVYRMNQPKMEFLIK